MNTQTEVVPEQHEELFPEDSSEIENTMDVTRRILAIRAIEKKIQYLKLQDEESRAFYATRIARCQEAIDVFKSGILAYLEHGGMKKIQTPAGTAFTKTSTKRIWPEEDVLLTWASASKPEAVRIIRQVDKRIAADYIHTTGDAPEGYAETTQISLCIR